MSTNGYAPARDAAVSSLAVGKNAVATNLTVNGRLTVKVLDVQPSFFGTINTTNVTGFQSSGGSFASLVSLQVQFVLLANLIAGANINVATLPTIHAPLGSITGVAFDSTISPVKSGTIVLTAAGELNLYNTSTVTLVAGDTISASLTYIV